MGGNLPLLRWDFVWKYQMCDGEREEEAPAFLNLFCEHLLQAPSRLRVNTGYSSQSSLAHSILCRLHQLQPGVLLPGT